MMKYMWDNWSIVNVKPINRLMNQVKWGNTNVPTNVAKLSFCVNMMKSVIQELKWLCTGQISFFQRKVKNEMSDHKKMIHLLKKSLAHAWASSGQGVVSFCSVIGFPIDVSPSGPSKETSTEGCFGIFLRLSSPCKLIKTKLWRIIYIYKSISNRLLISHI